MAICSSSHCLSHMCEAVRHPLHNHFQTSRRQPGCRRFVQVHLQRPRPHFHCRSSKSGSLVMLCRHTSVKGGQDPQCETLSSDAYGRVLKRRLLRAVGGRDIVTPQVRLGKTPVGFSKGCFCGVEGSYGPSNTPDTLGGPPTQ